MSLTTTFCCLLGAVSRDSEYCLASDLRIPLAGFHLEEALRSEGNVKEVAVLSTVMVPVPINSSGC